MDHSHDHDHHDGHGHSHENAPAHDHAHGDASEYFLNQLLTVFICGVFGVMAVLLYQTLGNANGGMMGKLLAPAFQLPVLIGGIALLVVVAVRGVCLWQSAGAGHRDHAHHDHAHEGHDHKPGEQCDHPDHNHAAHDHGDHSAEDHEHGNVYWRVVILAFPIFLFLMGVPSKGFSARWIKEYLGEEEGAKFMPPEQIGVAVGGFAIIVAEKNAVSEDANKQPVYDFKSLNDQSKMADARASLVGTRATLKGQFAPVPRSEREFSLVFLKMTCCANDKEPLRARIIAPDASKISAFSQGQPYPWVKVSGIISEFVFSRSTGEYVAIIKIDDKGGVEATEPVN